ncbi:MAG: hypothetical protein JWP87_6057 [Labilithrix sp.]|nr:hypothetical protein [Labilithrix sp.]
MLAITAALVSGCSLLTSLNGLSNGADGTLTEGGGADGPTTNAEGGSDARSEGGAGTGVRLFVFGGLVGGSKTASVLVADVGPDGTLGAWRAGPSLPEPRTYARAVAGTGFLAVVGGETPAGLSTATLVAQPDASGLGPWASLGQFAVPRIRHGVTLENGHLYVIGGTNVGDAPITDVQFAPITATSVGPWAATSSLPAARSRMAVASTPKALYVFGGADSADNSTADVYRASIEPDGKLGAFVAQQPLPGGRTHPAATTYGSHIVVTGGEHFDDVSVFEIDASTGTLGSPRPTLSLPARLDHHTSVRWENHLYLIGGQRNAGASVADVLVGDLDSDGNVTRWTEATPLPQALEYHTAVIY